MSFLLLYEFYIPNHAMKLYLACTLSKIALYWPSQSVFSGISLLISLLYGKILNPQPLFIKLTNY